MNGQMKDGHGAEPVLALKIRRRVAYTWCETGTKFSQEHIENVGAHSVKNRRLSTIHKRDFGEPVFQGHMSKPFENDKSTAGDHAQ